MAVTAAQDTMLSLPLFEERHRELARTLSDWADRELPAYRDKRDTDETCRRLVVALGKAGFLRHAVPHPAAEPASFDVRALCLCREILAERSALADFAFAMQGLGTASIALYGSQAQKQRYLPSVAAGTAIAAFALSEPDAGSDVAAMTLSATRDGPDHIRLDGEKTWISNGGIASHYVVFARSGEGEGARGISAFIVDADTAGLAIAERIDVMAPHPLARLRFDKCRLPLSQRLGAAGEGFKIAMSTLDIFRPTVGAAALGLARAALSEGLSYARQRRMFGGVLGDLQLTQAGLADMATAIDAASLLVYRAAWLKDTTGQRISREAAMAKMYATEAAQTVIDRAVQMLGALGVKKGSRVEELYRDIRALRIYEGATEVQKLIIGRDLLKQAEGKAGEGKA